MFGIGFPEMILILALALIVVGPDKLPEFARSIAKGVLELKKTAEGLKDSLNEQGNPLDEIRPELEDTAREIKDNIMEATTHNWKDGVPPKNRQQLEEGEPDHFIPYINHDTEEFTHLENDLPEEEYSEEEDYYDEMEDSKEIMDKNSDESTAPKIQNSVRDDLAAGPKS